MQLLFTFYGGVWAAETRFCSREIVGNKLSVFGVGRLALRPRFVKGPVLLHCALSPFYEGTSWVDRRSSLLFLGPLGEGCLFRPEPLCALRSGCVQDTKAASNTVQYMTNTILSLTQSSHLRNNYLLMERLRSPVDQHFLEARRLIR